jgi:acyl-CoA synthetase (AMP-forming)/AMP-acid ligase II
MKMAPVSVRELIAHQAALRPDVVYAIDPESGRALTFAQLARSCLQVQALLRAQGSLPGDTVSVVMPNGLATLQLLLGAMAGGWCVNPVNLLSGPEQLRHVLAHSDCRLVFVSPPWEGAVRAALAGVAREVAVLVLDAQMDAWPQAAQPVDARAPPDKDALALLMYTSGTTGLPKGVMLSHANLAANARAINAEHDLGCEDRVLAVLPLYHINALVVTLLAPLAAGGSLVLPYRFSATRFWAQALQHGCTWINLVPTMISYLLEGAPAQRPQLQGIRFCRSASAPLAVERLRAFEARFGIGVIETMGLTECAAPAFSNPLQSDQRRAGSVGRASGCEACVLGPDLRPLADGQTGEIALRGPNVMRGYYKDEAASRAAFTPQGWLLTGDLGRREADGFYFVTGRIKELIIKGGENIAPREIDEALLRHPAVLDAAAVGIPDRHYGQEIMACVVRREGLAVNEADLRAFCIEQLGAFKTPSVIRFVHELPRGPSGKVQRLKLLEQPG